MSPILNYCSEVCGFVNDLSIERVHLQFCKKILGVKKSTQNDFIYGELGRVSFKTVHLLNIIKYWLKILQLSSNKYVSISYAMLKDDLEQHENRRNWCSMLKDLLCSLGFVDAWVYKGVGNDNMFLN